ncbi:hypothetical protein QAD02_017672 [Eretmocerus hayati]|uniref:Uncharacterized protein n=1 Tax=Eretmocerus hayati TaxID=131215 RepID=A0ACC2PE98_9HYME|nr:hypothetical protein QAD02_017672 [Eretmocerus hayati]
MRDEEFEQLMRDYLRSGRRCAEYRRLMAELSAERRRRLDRERRRDEREVLRIIRDVEQIQRRRRPARQRRRARQQAQQQPAHNNSPVSSPERPQQRARQANWAERAARLWRPLSPELMPWDPQDAFDPQALAPDAIQGHQQELPEAAQRNAQHVQNEEADAGIQPPPQGDRLYDIVNELGLGPAAAGAVQIHIEEAAALPQEQDDVDWQQLALVEIDRLVQLAPEPQEGAVLVRVAPDAHEIDDAVADVPPLHQELYAAIENL